RRRVGKAVLARASNSPPSMRGACCLVGRIIGPSLLRPLQRDKGQPPPTWALLANLPPLARAAAPPAWPTPKKDVRSRTHHDLFCPKPAQSDVGLAGPGLERAFVPALGLLGVRSDASEVGFLEFGGIVGGPQGHRRFGQTKISRPLKE